MPLLFNEPLAYLDTFLLVLVRVLGLMLLVPFFCNRSIPYLSKVILAVFLSVLLLSTMDFQTPVPSTNIGGYFVAVVLEFFTGFALGFAAYMVFSILSLAGQFIDMQIGFSMVNVFDPMSQIQLTITGNLYYYILIMVTLVLNAHHYFIRALINSFYLIPLGGAVISPGLKEATVDFMPAYFSIALRVAAPVFFVMLITNVVLGVLARAVPQLNMFVIGFPLKIMFGLSTIFIMLSAFSGLSDLLIGQSERQMQMILEGMRPR